MIDLQVVFTYYSWCVEYSLLNDINNVLNIIRTQFSIM